MKKPTTNWRTLANLPVLVVDDNATNRQILKEVLTNWHMRPVAVESGPAALERLEESRRAGEPFAVVLLDAHMPDMDGFTVAERISRNEGNSGLKIVILTSAALPEDVSRCRRLGISASLSKPVKQSELFDVITSVIGEPARKSLQAPQRRVRVGSSRARLRVLVAEDNEINQLVARRIFEKLGHKVKIVGNGREAVSAIKSGRFDLVAMDVQMPEMDGLAATIAVRNLEKKAGTHIPIIAMTAHAMKGDRERCFGAGMDGYVSKPIRAQELARVISQVMSLQKTRKVEASSRNQTKSAIDQKALLAGVDGNRGLLRELARLFLADYPQHLAQIKNALRAGDTEALAKAVHTLKGAVGNFAARKAAAATQSLEVLAKGGELGAASDAYSTLESELAVLSEELKKIAMNPAKPRAKT